MIAKLTGTVDSVAEGSVIIDVGGVGYLVFCSGRTLTGLAAGEPVRLLVDTLMREDAIHLYGFADAMEQEWFRLLNTVQAVGARAALSVLSVLSPEELARAIAAGDRGAITRAPGVGPRLAGRIISELKEKAPASAGAPAAALVRGRGGAGAAGGDDVGDAVAALVQLGFSPSEASMAIADAVARLGANAGLEALIRDGLALLAPREHSL
jgi:holliday junction DNA helicase RuvA